MDEFHLITGDPYDFTVYQCSFNTFDELIKILKESSIGLTNSLSANEWSNKKLQRKLRQAMVPSRRIGRSNFIIVKGRILKPEEIIIEDDKDE